MYSPWHILLSSVTLPEEGALSALITTHERERNAELERLLGLVNQIDGWLSMPLPEGLGDHLREQRRRASDAVADLLLAWQRSGGSILLAGAQLPAFEVADVAARSPEARAGQVAAEPEVGPSAAITPLHENPPPVTAPVAALRPVSDGDRPALPGAPAAAPASILDLTVLRDHLASGGNFTAGLPAPDWRARLGNIVDELADAQDSGDEIEGLMAVLDGRDAWPALPAEAQVALVSWFVARIRTHQAEGSDERLDAAVRRLSAYQRDQNPGFVHGLARHHRPRAASWTEEASAKWDELLEFLPAEDDEPAPVASPRPSAKPAKPDEDDDEEEDARPEPIPADWAWRSWTQGRRAVMVGGDPREPNRRRLQDAFGFADLAWERAERSRNSLQQGRERVRSRKLDMVLILSRFVGHDADAIIQPACRDVGVAFVPVQTGYGVVGVRRAIERHLAKVGA